MSGIAYNRPAGGRGSKPYASGAGRQTRTTVGNTDYIIKAWDQVVVLTANLSTNRNWTLPVAASTRPGQTFQLMDGVGGLGVRFINVIAQGTDSIPGGFPIIAGDYSQLLVTSDGVSSWAYDPVQVGLIPRDGAVVGEWIVNGGLQVYGDSQLGATAFNDDIDVFGNVEAVGQLLQSGASAPLGYITGAGGTVTQNTSKSTAVTINRPCGAITTDNAALTGFSSVNFIVNNSTVTTGDVIVLAPRSAAYGVEVADVGPGFFIIRLTNVTAGSLSQAVVINFAVLNVATT
jgi:hypothetical protein